MVSSKGRRTLVGLVGITSQKDLDPLVLDRMIRTIRHADWHHTDRYHDSKTGLARVHLGTFNPDPQPLFNIKRSAGLLINGKIFEYAEEIKGPDLPDRGVHVHDDASVCLLAYEKSGPLFVKDLNGRFSIIVYEPACGKIVAITDRYGSKPLYFTKSEETFAVASEVKALLELPAFNRELNTHAVSDWFAFGELLGNRTFFSGIEAVPPATILTWEDGRISMESYWSFAYDNSTDVTGRDPAVEITETLRKAMVDMSGSFTGLGVSLSGGFDSRTVLAAASPGVKQRITALSFGPDDCDEVTIAREVSKAAQVPILTRNITPEMMTRYVSRCIYLTDGMDYCGASFLIPVSRWFRELSMEGVFSGFMMENHLALFPPIDNLWNCTSGQEVQNRYFNNRRLFSDPELEKLFNTEYFGQMSGYPAMSIGEDCNFVKDDHPVNIGSYLNEYHHVRRFAIMGMVVQENEVEMLIPAYDNRVIDATRYVLPGMRSQRQVYRDILSSLSPELARIKYNNTMLPINYPWPLWYAGSRFYFGKELFKRFLWRISGGRIALPNKRSYLNFEQWFRTDQDWIAFHRNLLLDENSHIRQFINQDYVSGLFSEHEQGRKDNSMKLINLASFELFLRLFLPDGVAG